MDLKNAYKFCPLCGKSLTLKDNYLQCTGCGHHLYDNPLPCNAAIIENKQREILLVKRKFPPKKGFWDLPGGFIDAHESLEQSVKRELKEELNIKIKVLGLVGIYPGTYLYQKITHPTFGAVVCAEITAGKLSTSDDIDKYEFFPRGKILTQKLAFKSVKQALIDYLKL